MPDRFAPFRSIWMLISPGARGGCPGSGALEAARLGAASAVLEGRHSAEMRRAITLNCDAGLSLPIGESDRARRLRDTRELWLLSKQARTGFWSNASEYLFRALRSAGALESPMSMLSISLSPCCQMLGRILTLSGGVAVRRVWRRRAQDDRYFSRCLYPRVFNRTAAITPWPGFAGETGGIAIFEDTPASSASIRP